MTARRILGHLRAAFVDLTAASRLARDAAAIDATHAPIVGTVAEGHARAAIAHLVEAATLISPAAGVRVAEAARRAFDDAHRRAVSRRADLDAHGLDEGGVAACAAEGTGGHVVDVVADGADEEGLHGGEGTPEAHATAAAAWAACAAVRFRAQDPFPIAGHGPSFRRSRSVTVDIYPGGYIERPDVARVLSRIEADRVRAERLAALPRLRARVYLTHIEAAAARRAWLDVVEVHGQHRDAGAMHVRRWRTWARKQAAQAQRDHSEALRRIFEASCRKGMVQ